MLQCSRLLFSHDFTYFIFAGGIKNHGSSVTVYHQFRSGIILPDTFKFTALESQKHTALHLHVDGVTYFFYIEKAVFLHQAPLLQMLQKCFIPVPSVAFSVPGIFCEHLSVITGKHNAVQALISLESVQEKSFNAFVNTDFAFDIGIQPILLISRRPVCEIMEPVV